MSNATQHPADLLERDLVYPDMKTVIELERLRAEEDVRREDSRPATAANGLPWPVRDEAYVVEWAL